nr:hypothetical protein [Tanacetum cinerariifolium]
IMGLPLTTPTWSQKTLNITKKIWSLLLGLLPTPFNPLILHDSLDHGTPFNNTDMESENFEYHEEDMEPAVRISNVQLNFRVRH